MVSEMGMSIRFPVAEVRTRQRIAGGVRGMELGPVTASSQWTWLCRTASCWSSAAMASAS